MNFAKDKVKKLGLSERSTRLSNDAIRSTSQHAENVQAFTTLHIFFQERLHLHDMGIWLFGGNPNPSLPSSCLGLLK